MTTAYYYSTMGKHYEQIQQLISTMRRHGIVGRRTLQGTHASLKITLDSFWQNTARRHDFVLYQGDTEYWLTVLEADGAFSLIEGTITTPYSAVTDTESVIAKIMEQLPNIMQYELFVRGKLMQS